MPLSPTVRKFMSANRGPKIILLDLQSTLSANFLEMGPNPIPESIVKKEQYKLYLVDWLRQVQKDGWEVHLFTVRRNDRQAATLESILTKVQWQPDDYWFKSSETGKAPEVKSAYLDRLIPERNPSALYALESNSATRKMFEERSISCRSISEPGDLPPLSEFLGSSRDKVLHL